MLFPDFAARHLNLKKSQYILPKTEENNFSKDANFDEMNAFYAFLVLGLSMIFICLKIFSLH